MRNYYEILGVSEHSEPEVIRAAYRAMMRKYHPDTNQSPSAGQRAKEINQAFEALNDPIRRRKFDEELKNSQSRAAPPPPPPPPPPDSVTEDPERKEGVTRASAQPWVIAGVLLALFLFFVLFLEGSNVELRGKVTALEAQVGQGPVLAPATGNGIPDELQTQVQRLEATVAGLRGRVVTLEAQVGQAPPAAATRATPPAAETARLGDPRNRDNWRQLGRGMTRDQVRALLGEPLRVVVYSGVGTQWSFSGEGEVWFSLANRVERWSEPR